MKNFLFWFAVAERRQAETHLIILDFVQNKFVFQATDTAIKKPPFRAVFYGGEGGIRTLGGFYTTLAFQASALDRYATSPCGWLCGQENSEILAKTQGGSLGCV